VPDCGGELAAADARRKALGETHDRLFAIGRDKLL
jgi:hypothetical protein